MRIRCVDIGRWRNLENVHFSVPPAASVVCLVGDNGVGKSNLLTALSAVVNAGRLLGGGAGPDVGATLGFDGPHDVSVTFDPPRDPTPLFGSDWNEGRWTGAFRISSSFRGEGEPATHVAFEVVGGVWERVDGNPPAFFRALLGAKSSFYLHLTSDRAFLTPPHTFDRPSLEGTRDRRKAAKPASEMYSDWLQFMAALSRDDAKRLQRVRDANGGGTPAAHPDPFEPYRQAVAAVMPHVRFASVNWDGASEVYFETGGRILPFQKLSSGEREIAFLVGQVFRFGLTRGLFLIDEPETHLNSSLLRKWVTWLRDQVTDGQTWIATHSLEAIEVAAQKGAVFLLERDGSDEKRLVKSARLLTNPGAMQALIAAVGAPAHSIARSAFVWIEGENLGDERARFERLCSSATSTHFIPVGNCQEVVRGRAATCALAQASGQTIRCGAIIDSDFRSEAECADLRRQGVHVLSCHEVENLFLHPATLEVLASGLERKTPPAQLILAATDSLAGLWVFQHASGALVSRAGDLSRVRGAVAGLSWAEIGAPGFAIEKLGVMPPADGKHFEVQWKRSTVEYRKLRESGALWKHCFGKQVLAMVHRGIGYADVPALEAAVCSQWASRPDSAPQEYRELTHYVARL